MTHKHGTPRQVAVAVAVQLDEQAPNGTAKVCIVTSRKHDDSWVLPKGGVEKGESAREAAARELWEEAGVRAPLDLPAWVQPETHIEVPDPKPHKKSPTKDMGSPEFVPQSVYSVHEFLVPSGSGEAKWLESHERQRAWVPFPEALERVAWRRGMGDALSQSALARSSYVQKV